MRTCCATVVHTHVGRRTRQDGAGGGGGQPEAPPLSCRHTLKLRYFAQRERSPSSTSCVAMRRWVLSRESKELDQQPHTPCVCSQLFMNTHDNA